MKPTPLGSSLAEGDYNALSGPVDSVPQALKLSVETQDEFWWAFRDENRGITIKEEDESSDFVIPGTENRDSAHFASSDKMASEDGESWKS